jgi:hypothetical protein
MGASPHRHGYDGYLSIHVTAGGLYREMAGTPISARMGRSFLLGFYQHLLNY